MVLENVTELISDGGNVTYQMNTTEERNVSKLIGDEHCKLLLPLELNELDYITLFIYLFIIYVFFASLNSIRGHYFRTLITSLNLLNESCGLEVK